MQTGAEFFFETVYDGRFKSTVVFFSYFLARESTVQWFFKRLPDCECLCVCVRRGLNEQTSVHGADSALSIRRQAPNGRITGAHTLAHSLTHSLSYPV